MWSTLSTGEEEECRVGRLLKGPGCRVHLQILRFNTRKLNLGYFSDVLIFSRVFFPNQCVSVSAVVQAPICYFFFLFKKLLPNFFCVCLVHPCPLPHTHTSVERDPHIWFSEAQGEREPLLVPQKVETTFFLFVESLYCCPSE